MSPKSIWQFGTVELSEFSVVVLHIRSADCSCQTTTVVSHGHDVGCSDVANDLII